MVKKQARTTGSAKSRLAAARTNYKLHMVENPNYFGSISKLDIAKPGKVVFKLLSNTSYEELTCIGFDPDRNELNAVVVVKKKSGYSGGPCTDGSKEFVRFYVDYENNGTWVDEGVVCFDAHDLPFGESLCYSVKIRIDPDLTRCCDDPAVLPKVRTVLSWNLEPPADQPNWTPTWGNHHEAFIQIDPRWSFWCLFADLVKPQSIGSLLDKAAIQAVLPQLKQLPAEMPSLSQLKPAQPELSVLELKRLYKKSVGDLRIAHKTMTCLLAQPNQALYAKYANILSEAGISISALAELFAKTTFNTSYEELKCVGLNRDLNTLSANIRVKRKSGYSGDLCTAGSRQYVAFYLDFGSGWQYQGTSSVNVHDIPTIPSSGLWYGVELPINLSAQQLHWCQTGKAKVRAILSWNTPPTPDNPDYVATWGDWEECMVEVKPLPEGVVPGDHPIPFIESLGGMPVSTINTGTGLASGSNGDGLTGNLSPFDGRIMINGLIFNAPDSSGPPANLEYRIRVKGPGETNFTNVMQPFFVNVTTINNGIPNNEVSIKQTPDADGFVPYLPDKYPPLMTSVDRAKLGEFHPAVSGLHELFIHVLDPDTDDEYVSNKITFMVYRKRPEVSIAITSGGGNCGMFGDNEMMQGTFSITGDYCDTVRLYITPGGSGAPSHGTQPVIVGKGDNQLDFGIDLPDGGYTGNWELNTNLMDPCGYNIWVFGEDRTIVNSIDRGHKDWDPQGFCVVADEEGV